MLTLQLQGCAAVFDHGVRDCRWKNLRNGAPLVPLRLLIAALGFARPMMQLQYGLAENRDKIIWTFGQSQEVALSSANYFGVWILIPELCIYQKGEPPLSGKYTIAGDDTEIRFRVDWTDGEGTDHKLEFGGFLGGARQEVKTPGITGVSYDKIDDNTLDSTAYINADIVMYARRVVSWRKDLLAVSQVTYTDDGSFTNFQVYRREGP